VKSFTRRRRTTHNTPTRHEHAARRDAFDRVSTFVRWVCARLALALHLPCARFGFALRSLLRWPCARFARAYVKHLPRLMPAPCLSDISIPAGRRVMGPPACRLTLYRPRHEPRRGDLVNVRFPALTEPHGLAHRLLFLAYANM
jgi:hypothetical protein